VTLRILLLAAAALAGCGCGSGEHGTATLWVTRDQGAHVLLTRDVPAGLTAMQALDRATAVETRYGGRFVQGINGVEGSLGRRHDWFYFINGYEADRSASEYRLHDGDVEWWDYRSWIASDGGPLVAVGSYPEPFLHGFGGKLRPVFAVGPVPRSVAARLRARVVAPGAPIPPGANVLACGSAQTLARFRFDGGSAGDPVLVTADCRLLAERPRLLRFRYTLP
jgi:Domain of unknown function (DUF4430)